MNGSQLITKMDQEFEKETTTVNMLDSIESRAISRI